MPHAAPPAPQHGQNPKLLASFPLFLFLVWRTLALPKPTKVQLEIAEYLQQGPRRRVIQAFRGVGKTWVTAAYVVWRLYCNPQLNILVVSASKSHADNITTFMLQIIHSVEECAFLIPRPEQRESKVSFDVAPAQADVAPSVRSAGITGQITGGRADLIIPDDIEIPSNSMTQLMRDQLRERIKEFEAVLKPNGEVIFLGTPQTENSVYLDLPARGYGVRVWPARQPSAELAAIYGEHLAPSIAQGMGSVPTGTPTDPDRFSDLDLCERENSIGRSTFALQFMLDTSLSDANRYPLKIGDLIAMDLSERGCQEIIAWSGATEYVDRDLPSVGIGHDLFHKPRLAQGSFLPYHAVIMSIDPSGRGSDELAYAIVGALHGQCFVLACGGLQGGYHTANLEALAKKARQFGVRKVIIEANYGDGMFTALFVPVLKKHTTDCGVEEVKHSQQKEKRIIDTLEPVMNRHKLVVDRQLVLEDAPSTSGYPLELQRHYQLFYQLTRITRDRGSLLHDDRLDALAIAVAHWVESMAMDADGEAELTLARWHEQQLKDFVAHLTGQDVPGASWCAPTDRFNVSTG